MARIPCRLYSWAGSLFWARGSLHHRALGVRHLAPIVRPVPVTMSLGILAWVSGCGMTHPLTFGLCFGSAEEFFIGSESGFLRSASPPGLRPCLDWLELCASCLVHIPWSSAVLPAATLRGEPLVFALTPFFEIAGVLFYLFFIG